MMDTNTEPTEVTLTRLVQGIEHLIDGLAGGLVGPNADPNMGLTLDEATHYDVRLRRSLWRAVGFAPCDELGETECGCDEDEPRPMTSERPCTGMWRGCSACGHLCYAEGVGEYDVCKVCHWERRCLAPELNACSGTCEVYGDAA